MPNEPVTKRDVARRYRDKHGMEMPTKKLARIMYSENNLLFKDVEVARRTLREIEGKAGKSQKNDIAGNQEKAKYFKTEERPRNPYNLPESDEIKYEPHYLDEVKKIGILSDLHIPFHSLEALTAALDYLKNENPDCILLNGDVLDFYGISRFVKDPSKRKFSDELDMFSEFFKILNDTFPLAKKIFKIGNHEERYQHFLWMKAKELVGVDEFKLENIIKKRADGVVVVGDKRIINANGLNIIHGHEFSSGFFSPVNVARGLFLRAKTSALQCHSHQTSEHTETDMNGKITTTWSVGALCELHPQFAPINKWNHGFALITITDEGFDVINKRIYKGQVL